MCVRVSVRACLRVCVRVCVYVRACVRACVFEQNENTKHLQAKSPEIFQNLICKSPF